MGRLVGSPRIGLRALLRWTAAAALLLAGCALAAGLLLAPPLLSAGEMVLVTPPPPLPALLPWAAALLGLLAAVLALLSGRPVADPATAPAATLAWQDAAQALRGLLQTERGELAALRESCGAAAHDAMMAGARLAGVAMDAETRLLAGVAQAEARLDRAPPDGMAATHPIADPAASVSVTEAAIQAMAAAAAELTGQLTAQLTVQLAAHVAGIGEAAGGLRRDAAALDAAGREIAVSSAEVIARIGEAVGHAGMALNRLPQAAAGVGAAAERAARDLTEAASALRRETEGLVAAARAATQAA